MSTLSQGMKFKLGGFFKQLFTKAEKVEAVNPPAKPPLPVAAPAQPKLPAKIVPAAALPGNKASGPGVEIPLASILANLPAELKSKVCQENVTGLNFSVPVASVLPQLASGAVKVCFGDIRTAAPGVFSADGESDATIVLLPLNELLSRLNPALLTRRPTQKQVVVPEEISSPFAGRGTGLNLGVGNSSSQTPGAPAAPQVAAPAPVTPVQRASNGSSASPLTAPLPGGTDLFQRKVAAQATNGSAKPPIFPRKPGAPASNGTEFLQRKTVAPTPSAPAADVVPMAPIAFKPSTPLPTSPVSPIAPTPSTPPTPADDQQIFQRKAAGPASDVPVHAAAPLPSAPPRSKDLLSAPPVARSIQPSKPAAAPAADSETLLVPLTAVAESWPEAVRQEVVQTKLVDARLAIPVDLVEEALKRGRVAFNWKTVRSWVRPGPASPASPYDAQELELPLAVLAPIFVARRKATSTRPAQSHGFRSDPESLLWPAESGSARAH